MADTDRWRKLADEPHYDYQHGAWTAALREAADATLAADPRQAALELMILEHPLDDGPRLVFADWLEEQGETARAEFIRVRIEWDNLPECGHNWVSMPGGWKCYTCRRKDELHKEYPIWEKWHEQAQAEFDKSWPGLEEFQWTRGFVSHISAPLATLIGGGECTKCQGIGYPVGSGNFNDLKCKSCGGTGIAPGIGYELVRAAPICEVNTTDREPLGIAWLDQNEIEHREWVWQRSDHGNEPQTLPGCICDRMKKLNFPTAAAARAALSRAMIGLLREGEVCVECAETGTVRHYCSQCRGKGHINLLPRIEWPQLQEKADV